MAENLTCIFVVNGWLLGLLVGWIIYKWASASECNWKAERDLELLYRFYQVFIWPWGLVQLILLISIYWYGWSA